MKKYLVVAWHDYYPAPGLGNIKASFDTQEEAKELTSELDKDEFLDNIKIIDRDTLEIVLNVR